MQRRAFLTSIAAAPLLMRGCANGPAVVLVTADTESHVAVVAPAGGRIRQRISTRPGPRSIEAAPGGRAVVAHTTEGVVTLLEDRRVRRVLGGFTEPRYTAVHPDGRWAFVSDSGQGSVHVIDLVRGRVVGGADVGDLARHITIAPDGGTLWVALGTRAEAVAVVDVQVPTGPVVRGRIVPPFLAHDVACTPDGRRLWISSGTERRLAVYPTTGPLRPLVRTAGAPPQHVTFGPVHAYVASGDDGTLEVRGQRDGRVRERTVVPVGSYNVQRGRGWVVTPSLELGTLVVTDLSGSVVSETQVAANAHDACVAHPR
jgi:DNA-binding beta-propeller fold protein YncE